MKVVVCVKQTPSTTAVFAVKDGAVSWEDPGGKPNVVNPWDEYAVEEAIKFKEERGATVGAKVMSIGSLWLGIGVTEVLIDNAWLRLTLLAVALGVSAHLMLLKTIRR